MDLHRLVVGNPRLDFIRYMETACCALWQKDEGRFHHALRCGLSKLRHTLEREITTEPYARSVQEIKIVAYHRSKTTKNPLSMGWVSAHRQSQSVGCSARIGRYFLAAELGLEPRQYESETYIYFENRYYCF